MAQEEARHEQVSRWDGDAAGTGELDEVRAWVVWGEGRADDRAAEPERAEDLPGEPGNDIARQIAAANDPDWKPDASTSNWGPWTWLRLPTTSPKRWRQRPRIRGSPFTWWRVSPLSLPERTVMSCAESFNGWSSMPSERPAMVMWRSKSVGAGTAAG